MAMAIVITVMSIAAILAWAMLAGTSIQSQVSSNGINAAIADAQAESGVHLAMYYLLNPQYSPVNLNSFSPVILGSGITFASTTQPAQAIAGNCSVTVQETAANQYTVTSIGSSAGSGFGGGVITRTVTGQVQVNTSYQITQAGTFNSAVTLKAGTSITSAANAISSSSTVTMSGGSVTGAVHTALSAPPAPTSADLHDYSQNYTYQGASYSPVKLASATLSNQILGPTAGNPLGVFWYGSDVFLAGNNTINGTIVVKNGNLWLSGKNNTITAQSITSQTTMPAVVVDKQLEALLTGNTGMTANGVVYAGTGLKGVGGSTTNVSINGALLINSGGISNFLGTLNVTYNTTNTTVPNLSTANQTPTSVQIISWLP
jgi:hypothetical protein